MADLINRLLNKLGGYRDEDLDYDDSFEPAEYGEQDMAALPDEPRPVSFRRQASKVVDMKSSGQQQVVIMQPADIEAAQQASDHIRAGKTVICNIEKVDGKVAQRVIDFITGAAYALEGKVMPVSSVIFVVAPRNTALVEGGIVNESMEYIRQTAGAR